MVTIQDWFNKMDYQEGVLLYASHPLKNRRYLDKLQRGKNQRNMGLLISELRRLKKVNVSTPVKQSPKPKTTQSTKKQSTKVNTPFKAQEQKKEISTRSKLEFGGIMAGDLPPNLRPRFFKAKDIFHQLIELKFALNDLPDNAQESALAIQNQIFALDEERDLIWAELHHYKNHGTLLLTDTIDFSGLSSKELVDGWYEELIGAKEINRKAMLEGKINNSEKKLHLKRTQIKKIKDLLE